MEQIKKHIKGVVKSSEAIHTKVSGLIAKADPQDVKSITHGKIAPYFYIEDLQRVVVDDGWIDRGLIKQ